MFSELSEVKYCGEIWAEQHHCSSWIILKSNICFFSAAAISMLALFIAFCNVKLNFRLQLRLD